MDISYVIAGFFFTLYGAFRYYTGNKLYGYSIMVFSFFVMTGAIK